MLQATFAHRAQRDAYGPVAQIGSPGQEFFAHDSCGHVWFLAHGYTFARHRHSGHSPHYLRRQEYCVLTVTGTAAILPAMFSKETQALMEAAVDAIIVIDHRGLITAVNDATRRMFGYRTDELLGENVSKLMPEPDRSAHDDYMRKHLETGRARIIGLGREVTARRSDGTPFPAHLSVGRISDGGPPRFVGIVRDITVERDAYAALRLERDRANAYLELNESILLMLDPQRRILEINARGSDLLGAPSVDLHGRDWLDFLNGDAEREHGLRLLEAALGSHGSREREFAARDASGAECRIYWRCIARLAADGSPAGWLCSGVDLTERSRRDEERLIAQDRLTRVARMATMGEMAAGVAHELNQPLTAITTYARACERYLERPAPDLAEVCEAVREIGAEGLRAGEIIRRLRALVRNDVVQRHAVDVNTLLDEIKVLMNADARTLDARLCFSCTPGLPPVEVDSVQIQQVVLNLVRNALEAVQDTPRGTREIAVATSLTSGGDVEVRVTDNGPGVHPQVAGRLFDPFCTTKASGTGLGLAMSRTIVESHKGTIGTVPVTPHGATFFVRLPAQRSVQ
jgi:two-component system sensor kinase FixL